MHTGALKKRQNAALAQIRDSAFAFLEDSELPEEEKAELKQAVEGAQHHNANIRELFRLEALGNLMEAAADPDAYLAAKAGWMIEGLNAVQLEGLANAGLDSIEALSQTPDDELKAINQIGDRALASIRVVAPFIEPEPTEDDDGVGDDGDPVEIIDDETPGEDAAEQDAGEDAPEQVIEE